MTHSINPLSGIQRHVHFDMLPTVYVLKSFLYSDAFDDENVVNASKRVRALRGYFGPL